MSLCVWRCVEIEIVLAWMVCDELQQNRCTKQLNYIRYVFFERNSFTLSLCCLSTLGTLSQISITSNAFVHLLHLIFDYKIEKNVKCQFEMANNSLNKLKSRNFYNRFHFLVFYWHWTIRETNLMCISSPKKKNELKKCMQFQQMKQQSTVQRHIKVFKKEKEIWIKLLKIPSFVGKPIFEFLFVCSWEIDHWEKCIVMWLFSNVALFHFTKLHFLNSVFVIRFQSQWANCKKCTVHAQSTG